MRLVSDVMHFRTSPETQAEKNLPAVQETRVLSLGQEDPCRKKWQPTPVFLPGESHGQRRLAGYSPWGHTESLDTTEKGKLNLIGKLNSNSIPLPGKPFSITVIQVYAPTINAEEAEVEQFYEDLQNLLRTNTPKRCPFHYWGLECQSRKSRNTWGNRQIWPWNTE